MAEPQEPANIVPNIGEADRLRVFISYARSDGSDFAEYLVVALKLAGFDAYLDRHDIAKAEDWEARLGELISRSDSVVFIITPASVRSPRCDWEVKRTVALDKRLVPVQWIAVPEADVPIELKRLNYTVFTSGEAFNGPFRELAEALRQDLHWLRQRTQLEEQAERWHGSQRDPDLLLRGKALIVVRGWVLARKPNAPEISPVLNAFIGASEEDERLRNTEERKRLSELAEAHAAKARALEEVETAQTQRAKLQRRSSVALALVGLLVVGAAIATLSQTRENNIRESEVFSSLATIAMNSENPELAMRYALAGLPPQGAFKWMTPWSPTIANKLASAAQSSRFLLSLPGTALFGGDGKTLIAWNRDTVRVVDAGSGEVRSAVTIADASFWGVSANGTVAVAVSKVGNGELQIWDLRTGKIVNSASLGFDLYDATMNISPDGHYAVVFKQFEEDNAVLEIATGHRIAGLNKPGEKITNVYFSPDNSLILATIEVDSERHTILRTFEAATGRILHDFPVGQFYMHAVLDAAQKHVAIRNHWQSVVRLLDFESGSEILRIDTQSVIHNVVFSRDGKKILTAQEDGTARLWNAENGQSVAVFRGHARDVNWAEFSPDETQIVTGSDDRTARIWSVATNSQTAVLLGHTDQVTAVAFSQDGSRVATISYDGTTRLWIAGTVGMMRQIGSAGTPANMNTPLCGKFALVKPKGSPAELIGIDPAVDRRPLDDSSGDALGAELSADGSHAVIAYKEGTLGVWRLSDGTRIDTIVAGDAKARSMTLSRDGSRLMIANANGEIQLHAVNGRAPPTVFRPYESGRLAIADLFPDGGRVLTLESRAEFDQRASSIQIWDAKTARKLVTIGSEAAKIEGANFAGGGRYVVATSWTEPVRVFDSQSGREILTLKGHTSLVNGAVFSPDAKRIVTYSYDETARIWDASSGRLIAILRGHEGAVLSAAFSPDGTRIITGGDDKTARIWDALTGMETGVLRGNTSRVIDACFGEDSRIATRSSVGELNIWDVEWAVKHRDETLVDDVCTSKLRGARSFNDIEMSDPVLQGKSSLRGVCDRAGPLSLAYWTFLWEEDKYPQNGGLIDSAKD